MSTPLRVLMVEDSEDDAALVVRELRRGGYDVTFERVDTALAMTTALARQVWDVVLSDHAMPRFSGLAALAVLKQSGLDLPFILISGTIGEEIAVNAMKAGVHDYLMKGNLARLVGAVQRELREAQSRLERKRADENLESSLSLLAATLESTADGILAVDQAGRVVTSNQKFAQMWGIPESIIASRDDNRLLGLVQDQLKQPEAFLAKVKDLHLQPEAESYDLLDFKDGRIFERYSKPQRIAGKTVGRVWSFRDITERRGSEEALRASEERFRLIAENVADLIALLDLEGRRLYNSPSYKEILGEPESLTGTNSFEEIHPDDRDKIKSIFEETVRTGVGQRAEFRFLLKGGTVRFIESQGSVVRDQAGKPAKVLVVSRDVTERKQLEAQLLQAQKMEAIGQLAGGVAHDFNNLLTIITGYSQLLLERSRPGDPARGQLEEIKMAANRAASLTRQLLAFSRRQVFAPQVLDLNTVILNTDKMLRRLIGEDIDLVTAQSKELGRVKADPGQIEQVIMNLAVNARDAMPRGGKLTIETANVDLDKAYARDHVVDKPGPYVMLAVSDTGCGMDAQTQAHIFEPFFTTKENGKGTGLGLSTVYGIVKQSGGYIWVYSELGRGTTFKIYLPRVEELLTAVTPTQVRVERAKRSEAVLVVEDEAAVRSLVREVLRENGYTVLEAHNVNQAVSVCNSHEGPIDLLLTDVVMPQMNGRELAKRLVAERPEIKVLYMSGYTNEAAVHHGVLAPGVALLQKPFTPDTLARKVREVLDNGKT